LPRIETELAGTCRTENIEEFIDFGRAHASILSYNAVVAVMAADGTGQRQHTPLICCAGFDDA
jgi:hypothetical protein